uniref:Uncharacterized protein n=1 Tax=Rhizophora mucronata TaxID=61149 RepID=A0A2P2QL22_RHIMU
MTREVMHYFHLPMHNLLPLLAVFCMRALLQLLYFCRTLQIQTFLVQLSHPNYTFSIFFFLPG